MLCNAIAFFHTENETMRALALNATAGSRSAATRDATVAEHSMPVVGPRPNHAFVSLHTAANLSDLPNFGPAWADFHPSTGGIDPHGVVFRKIT